MENYDGEVVARAPTGPVPDSKPVSGLGKEELGKLTDSACESLNESEDSASKCLEGTPCNDSVSDEKDSLGCADEPELSDSEEGDDSADNNTFNVNNTENSESQEISELTNEDSNKENDASDEVGGETQSSAESVSEETPSSLENEESLDQSASGESLDEETSKSKTTDEVSTPSSDKSVDQNPTTPMNEKDYEESAKNQIVNKVVSPSTNIRSPKIKKKIPVLNKSNKNAFTIEIFESKRKTEVNLIGEQVTKETGSLSTNDNGSEKSTESPCSSDKPSSDHLTLTLETASPDSAEKTSSLLLDVSQAIKEESEQSDDLSPIKSLVEDNPQQDLQPSDTTKKETSIPKSHTSPPTDLGLKSPSSFKTVAGTTPTKELVSTPKNGASPVSEGAVKKQGPMAFTVELGDSAASDSSGSSAGKKLDITASISQWLPKHRRNLSLTKVEENKKVEERQSCEKPPIGRPRSGTVGAGGLPLRRGGYHSEGYFSSDQDEDGPKKSELKSPRSPRTPLTAEASRPALAKSPSQDLSKGSSVRMRPPSPASSPFAVPLNESASYLIERIMNTPETKRKHNSKAEGRTCCKERERKPSVSELTGKTYKSEKTKMGTDSKKQSRNTPTEDLDPMRDDKDDVSEAGTYTIDKDSPEADAARSEIDRVFGVESEAELSSSTILPMSTTDHDESSWLSEVPPAISRNSPNWIHQWAAQVAEQTKPPVEAISPQCKTSPRVHKESPESRPRRKLPTVPAHLSNHQRTVDTSDSETLKSRPWRDSTDLTSDSDGLLRDTEHLVTSLQARVHQTKNLRNASFESQESCGDSDGDTFHNDERLSSSLRAKLKLTGLHTAPKGHHSPTAPLASPRRTEPPKGLTREATYDLFQRDEQLQSDSSSETSDPYKDAPPRPPTDNNPPLKFNRAFSLRRARLSCDEPVVKNEKKKSGRPSSAGATRTKTKTPLGTTKSYQSMDGPSVSSPRGCGLVSPRASSKGVSPSDSFDRTDGGRFSLRLPRPGAAPIGLSKSPSKSSLRKEPVKKGGHRSNSTLTSKEMDFQNWKRRKNYDPMKAAAEGRKKKKEDDPTPPPNDTSEEQEPSSPLGSLLRSASFHGTEGGMAKWGRKQQKASPQTLYTSEDDGPFSLEEDLGPHPSPRHGSPLRRSPTSPHQLCPSPARPKSNSVIRTRRTSLGLAHDNETPYHVAPRKVSIDESGSEGKRSPLHQGTRGAAASAGTTRPKTKMEALDNLVISTIHSLSSKVRTTSESLLQKLKSQYNEEGDRAALLEEVLSHLSESDQSSGQTRSTSRELAGILRNLKKIEHALGVIDRVIIVGDDDDYPDDEDLLDEVPQDWVEESDY